MEKIIVHAKFHTGHRQPGYPGVCRFVHGHTWRGTITIATEAFPRDELDMSLDFGHLKKTMRDLDHKMLVTAHDATFMDPSLFEPEGIVVMQGKGPSVENVAIYVFDKVVEHGSARSSRIAASTTASRCDEVSGRPRPPGQPRIEVPRRGTADAPSSS